MDLEDNLVSNFSLELRVVEIFGTRSVGTVRYIGPVPPTTGVWLGVEWDDPKRGKHDGSRDGVQYFKTSHPNAGSFVRTTKVSPGFGVRKSIENRYGGQTGSHNGMDLQLMKDFQKLMNAPCFQVVGFDVVQKTQSDFAKLEVIHLRNMGVKFDAETDTDLSGFIPKVISLDLSENLFNSWDQILSIISGLPVLKSLLLSQNIIPISKPLQGPNSLSNLRHLVLGRMNYNWTEIYSVISCIPTLKILQAHVNSVTTVETSSQELKNKLFSLTEIDLNCNPLNNWKNSVAKFSLLPSLMTLKLNECSLTEIGPFDCEDFSSLAKIELGDNNINDWKCLGRLNSLPNLIELRVKNECLNPEPVSLTPNRTISKRQLVIAAVRRLQVLNGTEIDRQERRGAEIDYLKMFGLEYLESGCTSDKPRFEEIVQIHGMPEESELRIKKSSIEDNFVVLNLRTSNENLIEKKLPKSMSVRALKLIYKKVFKVSDFELEYFNSSKPDVIVPLDEDMRDISYFGIENGDTVRIVQ